MPRSLRRAALLFVALLALAGLASPAWAHVGSEDAKPAPRLTVVGDPSAGPTPTTTSVAPSTTLDLPGTTNQAEQRDDGDESPAPWLIGGGIAAAAMVGAGGWWLSRRG